MLIFFSIGTNDLTQYVLAIDRTNNKVAKSYNTFHPTVLELIDNTIKAANQSGIPVTLCGEFATIPEAIPLLLGMGLKSLSMNPFFIPEVKVILKQMETDRCKAFYEKVKLIDNPFEIKRRSANYLNTNGIIQV